MNCSATVMSVRLSNRYLSRARRLVTYCSSSSEMTHLDATGGHSCSSAMHSGKNPSFVNRAMFY